MLKKKWMCSQIYNFSTSESSPSLKLPCHVVTWTCNVHILSLFLPFSLAHNIWALLFLLFPLNGPSNIDSQLAFNYLNALGRSWDSQTILDLSDDIFLKELGIWLHMFTVMPFFHKGYFSFVWVSGRLLTPCHVNNTRV